ncbi:MAG TPA: 2-succinyl-5-enolpyruvyl-6-hydroxy-3-cyclohexene-1-carboxylic-acid synthase [Solirubrobacteraceae bacterium]|nr:2-succinyl-5-enolpyruvyl-6-hydroxy-3-cyclohexene-1-carboxylic-acid synthase [Solirubrobacteraceae bacterium]
MSSTTDTYVLLRAFVDELARCGMRHACTSPGSRSAPLVLSLLREPRLRCHSHVDERCAGFFALGLAKRSGVPAAVACTSGTAVGELAAAVIEAREARVPLLVLSADRPAELRENGAGQAIDQLKLFGSAAKWFFEVSLDGGSGPDQLRFIRTLACRAYWTALQDRPGAVHLNFPLREPLIGDEALPQDDSGRADGRPHVRRTAAVAASEQAEQELRELVGAGRRGVLVAGRDERDDGLPESAAAFACAAGWPLLADPLSGARRGGAAVAHYDALLRDERFASAHEPEVVVRVGDLPVSKPLRGWLAGLGATAQVALDPEGAWQDPSSIVSRSLALDPAAVLARLADSLPPPALDGGRAANAGDAGDAREEREWLARWRSADELAAGALLGVLDGHVLSEPAVAAELGVLLPEEATLFVASSMPVRDIESFWPVRERPPRVLCNRGANGIDGTVSAAFGAAAAGDEPVVLLIGDVALAHDIGGLLAARRLGIGLTIVLVNNGGGGIFDFLPVAGIAEHELYETHVATPTGLDFGRAAELYGLRHELAQDVRGFRGALEHALQAPDAAIVEVRTPRAGNVDVHRRIWEATARALSPQAAGAGPAA